MRIWLLAAALVLSFPAYCQLSVWPGDANNDSTVNTLDVLYIGIGYNIQGPARIVQGNIWQNTSAALWNNILPDSSNYAYLDCNGDGLIDANDLTAVQQNYGLTHGQRVPDGFPAPDSQSPLFYFTGIPDSIHAGDTVTVDVFAGTNLNPADFFGIALSFGYDTTRIVANSVVATPDSTINSPVDPVLFFTTTSNTGGSLEIALSRRANTGGSSGNQIVLTGEKLVSLSFIIEDNLIGIALNDPLQFSLSGIKMYAQNLDKISGQPAELSIPFAKVIAGTPAFELNNLRVYPQPASGNIMIDGLPENGTLIITELAGRNVIIRNVEKGTINNINCAQLAPGMYLMHIKTTNGNIMKKIMIE